MTEIKKICVLSENLSYLKNKWICDVFKEEFELYCTKCLITNNQEDADVIWLLAPWNTKQINKKNINKKYVVTTIHHIDQDKHEENKKYYDYVDSITTKYHVICEKVKIDLQKITNKAIIVANFWINEKIFFNISDKANLRKKYNIPINMLVIGSFQRDTEGKDPNLPKLSKGPDVLINILCDMKNKCKNPFVVLTGWRRTYIINKLTEHKIPYIYNELVNPDELNELYNTLDLYIVSSRVEGGPRSIMECGLAKIPIISTDVGIADIILNNKSIYNVNNFLTYECAKSDIEYAYDKSHKYTISNYMQEFEEKLFNY